MKRALAGNKGRVIVLTVILLLLGLPLLLPSVAGVSQCQVEVTIIGQLLDTRGQPLAAEELQFRFYVSPIKPDVVVTEVTDERGRFKVATTVPQHAYENTGYQCVEIQARMYVKDRPKEIVYQPGVPNYLSDPGIYEELAAPGSYTEGYVPLFHSLRAENSRPPENDQQPGNGFTDLIVTLGSEAEPCLFRYGQGDSAGEAALVVKHLRAGTAEQLAEAEVYLDSLSDQAGWQTRPKMLEGLAPLRVEQDGAVLLEAGPDNPLTELTVMGRVGVQEVIYYYDTDRDGDGIPDYEVTERHLTESGGLLPSLGERTALYAYREIYEGQVPAVTGYQYKGYEKQETTLQDGIPREEVVTDVDYRYLYAKQSGGGSGGNGGNGGSETDSGAAGNEGDPQPEPPPEETLPDEGPDQERPPGEETAAEELPEKEPAVDDETPPPDNAAPSGEEAIANRANQDRSNAARENTAISLTEGERQGLRNITFVKYSYQQATAPGETITYGFTGFENAFPYALQGFTIVDEPDPGLDLISIDLPAFRQGDSLLYDLTYITNQQAEQLLAQGLSAAAAQSITAPRLRREEYITELSIQFAEVPAGFGRRDEIQMTFRVWDDPPADQLHNRGFLFYEESGETVTVQSDDDQALVEIREDRESASAGRNGQPGTGEQNLTNNVNKSFLRASKVIPLLLIILGVIIVAQKRRQRPGHRWQKREEHGNF